MARSDAGTFLVRSHGSEAEAEAYLGELVRRKKEEEHFVDGARPGFTLGHSASVFDGAALAAEDDAAELPRAVRAAKTSPLAVDGDDACAGSETRAEDGEPEKAADGEAEEDVVARKRALEDNGDAEKQQHRSSPSSLATASVSTAPTTTSPDRAAISRKLAVAATTRSDRVRLQVKTKTRKTLEGISSPSDLMSPISRTLNLRKKPRTVLDPEDMDDEAAGRESDSDAPALAATQEMDEDADKA